MKCIECGKAMLKQVLLVRYTWGADDPKVIVMVPGWQCCYCNTQVLSDMACRVVEDVAHQEIKRREVMPRKLYDGHGKGSKSRLLLYPYAHSHGVRDGQKAIGKVGLVGIDETSEFMEEQMKWLIGKAVCNIDKIEAYYLGLSPKQDAAMRTVIDKTEGITYLNCTNCDKRVLKYGCRYHVENAEVIVECGDCMKEGETTD